MYGKAKKGANVSRKSPHGDSARAVGFKGRGGPVLRIYKRLENRPVLFPAIRPDTNGRSLSAAVKAVVDSKK